MAANYFALPKPQMPANAMIDFEPVNNALETMRQQRNFATQRGDMLDQRDYQRGRDAKQDQRMAKADTREDAKWFGSQAMAIDKMQGPQRAAAWQAILAKHPARDTLTPDYLDPMKGPAMVAAEAGQFNDPIDSQMKQADLAMKQAQINKLNTQIANGGSEYGKAGTIVQDPKTGGFYSVQYGARGEPKVTPLQIGGTALQPAKGFDTAGDIMFDKATGDTKRSIGPNLQGAEQAKVIGRETAERQMASPKAFAAMQAADAKADVVERTVDEILPLVSNWTAGPGSVLKSVPGTPSRDLAAKLDILKANAGFSELQSMRDNSPTGGALGAVAVQELQMLQSTIAAIEQAQTPDALKKAVSDYKTFIRESRGRRRQAFEATYGGGRQPQQSTGLAPGEYVWDGSKLVPKGQ